MIPAERTARSVDRVLECLGNHETFLILGHEDPDADCLGSQRALGEWLTRRGKSVHLCCAGAWKRPEVAGWQRFFHSRIPRFSPEDHVLTVILDCSSPERTGFNENDLPKAPTLVIDHHASGGDFGDIRFVDPSSPSTTLLIQRIIEESGARPSREEAELLFFGFCTDTGYFRHLESGEGGPLESAARLVSLGASPARTFRSLNGGRSLGSRRLLGRALNRAEPHFNGRLIITWEHWKDWRELGSERDSDMLYQLLTGTAGVEAVAVIREQNDGICVVGLRSITDLDVSEIARFFGGGGHKKASGCTISGDRHDAIEHLLRIFAARLD